MKSTAQNELAVVRTQSGVRRFLFGWLIATGLSLFFAAQIKVSAAAGGHPVGWGQALYWAFGDWYEWALLAPIIFWIARRYRCDSSQWPRSLVMHSLAGLTLSILHAAMCAGMEVLQAWWQSRSLDFFAAWRHLLANRLHFNIAVYALLVAAWQAWATHLEKRSKELEAQRLAEELGRVQLQALRMQLNPHFLFNSLNAISSLMLKDVGRANQMLCRLGGLLRIALESSDQQEVALRQELDFLRRYVEVEKIRFGEGLQLEVDAEPSLLEAKVPNMMLQPLVENAIRHAVEPNDSAGRITVRCGRSNGDLNLEISDGGCGLPENSETETSTRRRVGLNNIRGRLEKLYGARQSFRLSRNSRGGTTVNISVPFVQTS